MQVNDPAHGVACRLCGYSEPEPPTGTPKVSEGTRQNKLFLRKEKRWKLEIKEMLLTKCHRVKES